MTRTCGLLAVVLLVGCDGRNPAYEQDAVAATGGDPARGKAAIVKHGCASCHTIPGVPGEANVGPPLARVGGRAYLGGVLVNTPANMTRWLTDPPAVDPKTAMPNLGLPAADVADIACYLYTLR